MEAPSPEFMLLAASLLDALPPYLPVDDGLLLQLHAVFGPMLMSALQLIDRREVVRVGLPSKRHIYQVASSVSGKSYTLYINPPDPSPSAIHVPPTPPGSERAADQPSPPGNAASGGLSDLFAITTYDEPELPSLPVPITRSPTPPAAVSVAPAEEVRRQERVQALADDMPRMYCPCPGFAHNSLSGGRNVLCKHLLAVVIARKTCSEVCVGTGVAVT